MAVSTRKQSKKWFSDLFELMHEPPIPEINAAPVFSAIETP
jgi:hypothetical protein